MLKVIFGIIFQFLDFWTFWNFFNFLGIFYGKKKSWLEAEALRLVYICYTVQNIKLWLNWFEGHLFLFLIGVYLAVLSLENYNWMFCKAFFSLNMIWEANSFLYLEYSRSFSCQIPHLHVYTLRNPLLKRNYISVSIFFFFQKSLNSFCLYMYWRPVLWLAAGRDPCSFNTS